MKASSTASRTPSTTMITADLSIGPPRHNTCRGARTQRVLVLLYTFTAGDQQLFTPSQAMYLPWSVNLLPALPFTSYGFLTGFQAVPLYAITRVSQRL